MGSFHLLSLVTGSEVNDSWPVGSGNWALKGPSDCAQDSDWKIPLILSLYTFIYLNSHIKRNILNDGIIEQGTLGRHFTHIRRWNETRRDEVTPDFGDKCQMLGFEVDDMALIV